MEHIAHHKVGQIDVFCLTDGGAVFPTDVFPGVTDARRDKLLLAAGLGDLQTAFNCYVLRFADGRVTLFDTGCGAAFGANGGQMHNLLTQLDIAPEDVSRIIFSHLHSDHCGGALRDGTLVFPNAEIVLHRREAAFWAGQDAIAARLLDLVPDVTTVRGGDDLGDGLRIWSLPGHTPGHIGLRIGDLALVGDIVHSEALQLADPMLCPIYDEDAVKATQSRKMALSTIVDDGLVWSGCHMLGPDKFARLRRWNNGFERIAQ
ncbi:Glyoxylase, beta-lactamase superfamily II [Yoonia tamlensis]|uniref:Glyoxylase, beta-lactamase superfamily II n=1 Tax=Yoonia tamlensis TaxID=390270 RepID=A0A1I6G7B1_9RHOB|nr:MBL fold metallo-hydrolase [Yoonia tamlensis]SFR38088.1 Glyoxylase, beta-lactamase superfamily II [Yoonia tamlensis]